MHDVHSVTGPSSNRQHQMSRQAPDNGAADANDDDDVAVSEDGGEGTSSSGEEEESGDDDDESGVDESGDDDGESGSEASIAPVCLDQHGRILGVSGCGLDFGFRSFPRALDVERAERFHEVCTRIVRDDGVASGWLPSPLRCHCSPSGSTRYGLWFERRTLSRLRISSSSHHERVRCHAAARGWRHTRDAPSPKDLVVEPPRKRGRSPPHGRPGAAPHNDARRCSATAGTSSRRARRRATASTRAARPFGSTALPSRAAS